MTLALAFAELAGVKVRSAPLHRRIGRGILVLCGHLGGGMVTCAVFFDAIVIENILLVVVVVRDRGVAGVRHWQGTAMLVFEDSSWNDAA